MWAFPSHLLLKSRNVSKRLSWAIDDSVVRWGVCSEWFLPSWSVRENGRLLEIDTYLRLWDCEPDFPFPIKVSEDLMVGLSIKYYPERLSWRGLGVILISSENNSEANTVWVKVMHLRNLACMEGWQEERHKKSCLLCRGRKCRKCFGTWISYWNYH